MGAATMTTYNDYRTCYQACFEIETSRRLSPATQEGLISLQRRGLGTHPLIAWFFQQIGTSMDAALARYGTVRC